MEDKSFPWLSPIEVFLRGGFGLWIWVHQEPPKSLLYLYTKTYKSTRYDEVVNFFLMRSEVKILGKY
jgi:hypothetical protein